MYVCMFGACMFMIRSKSPLSRTSLSLRLFRVVVNRYYTDIIITQISRLTKGGTHSFIIVIILLMYEE